MGVNLDKPQLWKADLSRSVRLYNEWFMLFAPKTFRDTRQRTTIRVEEALRWTANLTNITPATLRAHPEVLPILRMACAPPIARDRLVGLGYLTPGLVAAMEDHGRTPPKMESSAVDAELTKIGTLIGQMADRDLFTWLDTAMTPAQEDVDVAAMIVADRLCGADSNPIIRNAQEQRQLAVIRHWLEARGYRYVAPGAGLRLATMQPGTFAFRLNVPVQQGTARKPVNIPIDAVVAPLHTGTSTSPLLIEAKSAGDFTNTNKRRKEEGIKAAQLRTTLGTTVQFILFLCGYFDTPYLGYEAAEGIDWVWEHRIDDLALFGL